MADTTSKADITNLDQDLAASRLGKYNDQARMKDTKRWIATVLPQVNEQELMSEDLMDYLHDGTVLCQLIDTVWRAGTIRYKQSKMAFVQMENIEQFLRFAQAHGIPQDELFQTIDLYESKDPYQVLMALQSLSRLINKQSNGKYPIIGPNLSKKHERPKVPRKPAHLQSGDAGWSTVEYGYMKGSNQETEHVVFGSRRDITDHTSSS